MSTNQIIGIKIGSQNSMLSKASEKIVNIILSETSNREIPTIVSYNEMERQYGDNSITREKSNYKRTIKSHNRWLGLRGDWSIAEQEKKYHNFLPTIDENNKIYFKINYKGNEELYSPESLMGLYLEKLKNIWKNRDKINTNSVVVSVPDYYTCHERMSLINSIKIAGLEFKGLLNESSAIALTYGFQNLKELDENDNRIVCFVDMGYAKTSISFASFNKKVFKVLSVCSDRFLGGRDFDIILAEHIAKNFEEKFNMNPMSKPNTKIRLLTAIEKIRNNLTVNKEGTVSVDSLMDGEDLIYNLRKAEFEKLISPLLTKFENLCKNSINKLKENYDINIEDIYSVEMAGEAVRTPIIQKLIKKIFGKEISKTLIPDESISKGCSLYAFKNEMKLLKHIKIEHYNPYSLNLQFPFKNKDGKNELKYNQEIKQGSNFLIRKLIALKHDQIPNEQNYNVKLFYMKDEADFMNDRLIENCIYKLPKKIPEKSKLKIGVILDENGLPLLNCNFNEEDLDDIKDELSYANSSEEDINKETQREKAQENEDINYIIACDKKNEIERYIYDIREKMNGSYSEYVTEDEKNNLNKIMDPLLNWLYSEDENCYDLQTLNNNSKELFDIGNKIYDRYLKWNQLEDSLFLFGKEISKVNDFLGSENSYSFNEQDLEDIQNILNNYNNIYKSYLNKTINPDKSKEPKIRMENVNNDIENFKNEVKKIFEYEELLKKNRSQRKENLRKSHSNLFESNDSLMDIDDDDYEE